MKLSAEDALKQGIEAHQAGRIQEADKYYTAILQAAPKHPDANHNMGVLAVGVGKVQEALPFLKTALEANPSVGQFWLSYIDALIKLNRPDDAKAILSQAKQKGAEGEGFDKIEQRLNKLKEDNAQNPPQHIIQELNSLYSQGEKEEALKYVETLIKEFPNSATLFNFEGAINSGLGKVDRAIQAFRKAISLEPNIPNSYNNLGNAQTNKGDFQGAIESFEKAIKINPNFHEAYSNLGIALKGKGDSKSAIASFRKALNLNPEIFQTIKLLGVTLYEVGDLDAAKLQFEKALRLNETFDTYFLLAQIQERTGDYASAFQNLKQCIQMQPDNPVSGRVYNLLGSLAHRDQKLDLAINYFIKAIQIKPEFVEAYYNIGIALTGIEFTINIPGVKEIILELLKRKNVIRPSSIIKAAISMLKFDPILESCSVNKFRGIKPDQVTEEVSKLTQSDLLLAIMRACPIPDLRLEAILSSVRATILLNINNLSEDAELIKFLNSLALQCFTNEYIYQQTSMETEALKQLEKFVESEFMKGDSPNSLKVLCLATYKSLNEYPWCNKTLNNKVIEIVTTRQIKEQQIEIELKSQIPNLKPINDRISSKVREQYEENPYPRWINASFSFKPLSVQEFISTHNIRVYKKNIQSMNKPMILNAGCGTGQHAIDTACKFKGSKVVAIDLSLNSLAYAQRKVKELRVRNIEFIQADILDVQLLGKKFDIIESVGVLHHMDDPVAGWQSLVDCLNSGGLMLIGLYSQTARKHITKIREELDKVHVYRRNYEIKEFRSKLIKKRHKDLKTLKLSQDFYSLSTFRGCSFKSSKRTPTEPACA